MQLHQATVWKDFMPNLSLHLYLVNFNHMTFKYARVLAQLQGVITMAEHDLTIPILASPICHLQSALPNLSSPSPPHCVLPRNEKDHGWNWQCLLRREAKEAAGGKPRGQPHPSCPLPDVGAQRGTAAGADSAPAAGGRCSCGAEGSCREAAAGAASTGAGLRAAEAGTTQVCVMGLETECD